MVARLLLSLLAALTVLLSPGSARADVNVTFYAHEFGENFPHAFVALKGSLDDGSQVDTNVGFTARTISPAILWGPVDGVIQTQPPGYVRNSVPLFTVRLDDSGYARLMARVERWRARGKKGYSLNRANCVHFVMELAAVAGLKVNPASKFFKKPRSFLQEVRALNPGLGIAS